MLAEMPLQELRLARGMTQGALANTLKVRQAAISKLERRTDMYISSLRSHIRALGGELEIVARFPDGEVRISSFEPKSKTWVPDKGTRGRRGVSSSSA